VYSSLISINKRRIKKILFNSHLFFVSLKMGAYIFLSIIEIKENNKKEIKIS
jgi:surface polysaccharide O-acyltransferase-like enzyme